MRRSRTWPARGIHQNAQEQVLIGFTCSIHSFSLGLYLVGDPTMAAVWRRQTFAAAVENVASETTRSIIEEYLPTLAALLKDQLDDPLGTRTVLEDAYRFSRIHACGAPTAGRTSFRETHFTARLISELGSAWLYPRREAPLRAR